MNTRLEKKSGFFPSQSHFHACQNSLPLLETKTEAAMAPSRQRRSFKFTSLFERWSKPTNSQAGVFLLRLSGGSRDPIHCGVGVAEPQDAGNDKIYERTGLEAAA
jgi:hypothetical protein